MRRLTFRSATVLVGIMTAIALSSGAALADGDAACKPKKSVRFLNVTVDIAPPGGGAGQTVTLTARCLPADRDAIILAGPAFDAVRPIGGGATDSLGGFEATASVPADAAPGSDYYFAIMIDDHAVGTAAFKVEGAEPAPPKQ